MNNTGISARRITALLCVLVFVLSLALTGCQIGSTDEGKTTTTEPTASQALEYVDPNQGVVCPKCGSSNTDDAWREGEEYDEHFICYDCEYEWYILNGVAYEIKDNGQSATIPNYTYRPNSNSGSSGNKGNNKTTTTTKPTTTASTTKGEDTFMFDGKEYTYEQFWKEIVLTGKILNYLNFYIDEEGNITTEGDKGVLGFAYSTKDKCFYASGNAWQRDYGYNELYDKTSQLIAISYDTINVYFPYKNKEWMVQFWKGQYGMVLLGAEIGVYNRSLKASASDSGVVNHYNAVSDGERLPISLTLYQNDKILFSRSQQPSWWQTGFVFGQLGVTGGVLVGSKYTDDLKVTTAITLKDEEMTNAFVTGLKAVSRIYNNVDAMNANNTSAGYRSFSFREGDGVTPGTYSVSGNTVKLAWK